MRQHTVGTAPSAAAGIARVALAATVALVGWLGPTAPLSAQPQASQHGTLSQTVNTTVISLEYDRPVLRGRSIFGELLDYDAVWTPGANRATWIDFSKPVTVEGRPVPAGRYGIWTIPHERAAWELILVSEWDAHHSFFPSEAEVLRVSVTPETASPMEVLAFYFPVVGPYETTLRFHWGDLVVPLRIGVER
jgi:hypothetical protein